MELLQFQIEIQFFHPTHSSIVNDSRCTNDTIYKYLSIHNPERINTLEYSQPTN